LKKGKPAVRQTQNIKGFIFSSFYYTNIVTEIYRKLKLEIRSTWLRVAPPCGTKAGISEFGLLIWRMIDRGDEWGFGAGLSVFQMWGSRPYSTL
jgi:hypothetical protein